MGFYRKKLAKLLSRLYLKICPACLDLQFIILDNRIIPRAASPIS